MRYNKFSPVEINSTVNVYNIFMSYRNHRSDFISSAHTRSDESSAGTSKGPDMEYICIQTKGLYCFDGDR
jgi:hypothetical protein